MERLAPRLDNRLGRGRGNYHPILLYHLGQRAVAVVQERKPMGALEHQLDALICFIGVSWGIFLALSLNPDNPAHFGMQMAIAAGASAASVKSLAYSNVPSTFMKFHLCR